MSDPVTLELVEDPEYQPEGDAMRIYTGYTLTVGSQSVTGDGMMLLPDVYAMHTGAPYGDIVLLVGDLGPSSDDTSYCYVYQDGKLYNAGWIGTLPENIRVSPGLFTGIARGVILQTWYHPADYMIAHEYRYDEQTETLLDTPKVVEVPRAVYPMGTIVTLGRDIDLKLTPAQDAQDVLTLHKGSKCVLTASDDVAWLYITAIDDQEGEYMAGWFYVGTDSWSGIPIGDETVSGLDLFDGLIYAD